jgi:hypothetical protein
VTQNSHPLQCRRNLFFAPGLRVFLYTADANEQIKLARALGADGIISTSPNEYKVAYREKIP